MTLKIMKLRIIRKLHNERSQQYISKYAKSKFNANHLQRLQSWNIEA